MQRITVDPNAWSIFRLSDPAELLDGSGHVLGYFTPLADPSIYDRIESPTNVDELIRRRDEGGGRALSGILRDFEKRA